jgi:hypothetical protein
MGFTRSLPELEASLDAQSQGWQALDDGCYKRAVDNWNAAFREPIEQRQQHQTGVQALEEFRSRLPSDVLFLSGIRIPDVANLGGRGAAAYSATALTGLDLDMARMLELVVVAQHFSWCLLLSHETGSWYREEFWRR